MADNKQQELMNLFQTQDNKSTTQNSAVFNQLMQDPSFDYNSLSVYSPSKKIIDAYAKKREKEMQYQKTMKLNDADMAILRYGADNNFNLWQRGYKMNGNDVNTALNNYQLDNMAFANIVQNANNFSADSDNGWRQLIDNNMGYIKNLTPEETVKYWDKLTPIQRAAFNLYNITSGEEFNGLVDFLREEEKIKENDGIRDGKRTTGEFIGNLIGDMAFTGAVGTAMELLYENHNAKWLEDLVNAKANFKNAMYSSTVGMIGDVSSFISQMSQSTLYAIGGEELASKNSLYNPFYYLADWENHLADYLTTEQTKNYEGFMPNLIIRDVPGVFGSIAGFMLTANVLGAIFKGAQIFQGVSKGSKAARFILGGSKAELGMRAMMSMSGATQTYDEIVANGGNYGSAAKGALTAGALNWGTYTLTEAIPGAATERVLKNSVNNFVRGISIDVLQEGVEEIAEQFAQDFGARVGGIGFGAGRYKDTQDVLKAYAYTGMLGAIGGAFGAGLGNMNYKSYTKGISNSYDSIKVNLGSPYWLDEKVQEYVDKGYDLSAAKLKTMQDLENGGIDKNIISMGILNGFKMEIVDRFKTEFDASLQQAEEIINNANTYVAEKNIDPTKENIRKVAALMFEAQNNPDTDFRMFIDKHLDLMAKADIKYYDTLIQMPEEYIATLKDLPTQNLNKRLDAIQRGSIDLNALNEIDKTIDMFKNIKLGYRRDNEIKLPNAKGTAENNAWLLLDKLQMTYEDIESLYKNEIITQEQWEVFKENFDNVYNDAFVTITDYINGGNKNLFEKFLNYNPSADKMFKRLLDENVITYKEYLKVMDDGGFKLNETDAKIKQVSKYLNDINDLLIISEDPDGKVNINNIFNNEFYLKSYDKIRDFLIDTYGGIENIPLKFLIDNGLVDKDLKMSDILELDKSFKKATKKENSKPVTTQEFRDATTNNPQKANETDKNTYYDKNFVSKHDKKIAEIRGDYQAKKHLNEIGLKNIQKTKSMIDGRKDLKDVLSMKLLQLELQRQNKLILSSVIDAIDNYGINDSTTSSKGFGDGNYFVNAGKFRRPKITNRSETFRNQMAELNHERLFQNVFSKKIKDSERVNFREIQKFIVNNKFIGAGTNIRKIDSVKGGLEIVFESKDKAHMMLIYDSEIMAKPEEPSGDTVTSFEIIDIKNEFGFNITTKGLAFKIFETGWQFYLKNGHLESALDNMHGNAKDGYSNEEIEPKENIVIQDEVEFSFDNLEALIDNELKDNKPKITEVSDNPINPLEIQKKIILLENESKDLTKKLMNMTIEDFQNGKADALTEKLSELNDKIEDYKTSLAQAQLGMDALNSEQKALVNRYGFLENMDKNTRPVIFAKFFKTKVDERMKQKLNDDIERDMTLLEDLEMQLEFAVGAEYEVINNKILDLEFKIENEKQALNKASEASAEEINEYNIYINSLLQMYANEIETIINKIKIKPLQTENNGVSVDEWNRLREKPLQTMDNGMSIDEWNKRHDKNMELIRALNHFANSKSEDISLQLQDQGINLDVLKPTKKKTKLEIEIENLKHRLKSIEEDLKILFVEDFRGRESLENKYFQLRNMLKIKEAQQKKLKARKDKVANEQVQELEVFKENLKEIKNENKNLQQELDNLNNDINVLQEHLMIEKDSNLRTNIIQKINELNIRKNELENKLGVKKPISGMVSLKNLNKTNVSNATTELSQAIIKDDKATKLLSLNGDNALFIRNGVVYFAENAANAYNPNTVIASVNDVDKVVDYVINDLGMNNYTENQIKDAIRKYIEKQINDVSKIIGIKIPTMNEILQNKINEVKVEINTLLERVNTLNKDDIYSDKGIAIIKNINKLVAQRDILKRELDNYLGNTSESASDDVLVNNQMYQEVKLLSEMFTKFKGLQGFKKPLVDGEERNKLEKELETKIKQEQQLENFDIDLNNEIKVLQKQLKSFAKVTEDDIKRYNESILQLINTNNVYIGKILSDLGYDINNDIVIIPTTATTDEFVKLYDTNNDIIKKLQNIIQQKYIEAVTKFDIFRQTLIDYNPYAIQLEINNIQNELENAMNEFQKLMPNEAAGVKGIELNNKINALNSQLQNLNEKLKKAEDVKESNPFIKIPIKDASINEDGTKKDNNVKVKQVKGIQKIFNGIKQWVARKFKGYNKTNVESMYQSVNDNEVINEKQKVNVKINTNEFTSEPKIYKTKHGDNEVFILTYDNVVIPFYKSKGNEMESIDTKDGLFPMLGIYGQMVYDDEIKNHYKNTPQKGFIAHNFNKNNNESQFFGNEKVKELAQFVNDNQGTGIAEELPYEDFINKLNGYASDKNIDYIPNQILNPAKRIENAQSNQMKDFGDKQTQLVDFSKYNLFKPLNENDAFDLHNGLNSLNELFDLYKRDNLEEVIDNILSGDTSSSPTIDELLIIQELTSKLTADEMWDKIATDENVYDIVEKFWEMTSDDYFEFSLTIKDLIKVHDLINNIQNKLSQFFETYAYSNGMLSLIRDILDDSKLSGDKGASTRLMQNFNYEGIDVRHLPALDNTEFGSVIYKIKEETLAKTKSQLLDRIEELEIEMQDNIYYQLAKMGFIVPEDEMYYNGYEIFGDVAERQLGEPGYSRVAFFIGKNKIIKLIHADNNIDFAYGQNLGEIKAHELYKGKRVAKMFYISPEKNWVISEEMRPYNDNDSADYLEFREHLFQDEEALEIMFNEFSELKQRFANDRDGLESLIIDSKITKRNMQNENATTFVNAIMDMPNTLPEYIEWLKTYPHLQVRRNGQLPGSILTKYVSLGLLGVQLLADNKIESWDFWQSKNWGSRPIIKNHVFVNGVEYTARTLMWELNKNNPNANLTENEVVEFVKNVVELNKKLSDAKTNEEIEKLNNDFIENNKDNKVAKELKINETKKIPSGYDKVLRNVVIIDYGLDEAGTRVTTPRGVKDANELLDKEKYKELLSLYRKAGIDFNEIPNKNIDEQTIFKLHHKLAGDIDVNAVGIDYNPNSGKLEPTFYAVGETPSTKHAYFFTREQLFEMLVQGNDTRTYNDGKKEVNC